MTTPCHSSPDWTDILTAIGTCSAVAATVILFFYERIKRWINRPVLDIGINFSPPDCNKTLASKDNKTITAYWFRLFVRNSGRSPAEDIEVTINEVFRRVGDKWNIYSEFLPSSLVWTHLNKPFLPYLLPGTSKNLDLGYILDPKMRYAYPDENKLSSSDSMSEILFNVILSIKPYLPYNILSPGEYKLILTIGAKNAEPMRQSIKIALQKEWKDDESDMLNNSISISKF
jgi:hypothetical protein